MERFVKQLSTINYISLPQPINFRDVADFEPILYNAAFFNKRQQ